MQVSVYPEEIVYSGIPFYSEPRMTNSSDLLLRLVYRRDSDSSAESPAQLTGSSHAHQVFDERAYHNPLDGWSRNYTSSNPQTSEFSYSEYNCTSEAILGVDLRTPGTQMNMPLDRQPITPNPYFGKQQEDEVIHDWRRAEELSAKSRIHSVPQSSSGGLLILQNTNSCMSSSSIPYELPSLIYPIIRRGSLGGMKYESFGIDTKLQLLDINFYPSLESVMQAPWSLSEEEDSRRIIRIYRHQRGGRVDLYSEILDSQFVIPPKNTKADFTEVSCIKNSYDREEGCAYYITSVEVLNVIEMIIGGRYLDRKKKRIERGRIRSNLCSLWLSEFSVTRSKQLSELAKEFLRDIARYRSHKPFNTAKEVRLLSWMNLHHAIIKAAEFYRVIVCD